MFLLVLAAPSVAAPPAAYPVRWSKALPARSREAAEKLLDDPRYLAGSPVLTEGG